jgi:hypothetical protein
VTISIERVREGIIGLRPIYTDSGNATEVILSSGEVFIDKRGIKAVQLAIARIYAIDLKAQRADINKRIRRLGVMPFYLKPDRVFVPFKMRQALADRDMVYGYIDLDYVKDIPDYPGRTCFVLLKTGQKIEVFSSSATAKNSLHLSQDLKNSLQDEVAVDRSEEVMVEAARRLIYELRDIAEKIDRLGEKIAE